MTSKLIIVLIAVIALLAGIVLYYFYLPSSITPPSNVAPQITGEPGITPTQEVIPSPATGNIDDTVSSLLMEVDDEAAVLNEVENDSALIKSDSQAIGDFGQSIDEKEL